MSDKSTTLAIRLEPELDSKLAAVAHHRRRSKSEIAREALRQYLDADTFMAEARRQSLLVSRSPADPDLDAFMDAALQDLDELEAAQTAEEP